MSPQPIRTHDLVALAAALKRARHLEEVRLAFFGRAGSPPSAAAQQVAEEVSLASEGRIGLDLFNTDDAPWAAKRFRVRHAPAIAVLGPEGDIGVRFYGTLEGYGAAGLVAVLRLAAGADLGLPRDVRAALERLPGPQRLRLFVDHQDERTPAIVRTVAAIAIASGALWADIVSGPDFPTLARIAGAGAFPTLLLGARGLPPTSEEEVLVREILREAAEGSAAGAGANAGAA